MSRDTILFEKALNEPYQQFLSVEALYKKANLALQSSGPEIYELSFSALLQLIIMFDQSSLVHNLIQALGRHQMMLKRLMQTPSINQQTLSHALEQIQTAISDVKNFNKARNQTLKNHDYLNRARYHWERNALSDYQAYNTWISLPEQSLKECFQQWLNSLKTYEQAVQLVLNLTRESAYPKRETAPGGKFYVAIHPAECQLIRVGMKRHEKYYPEISFVNKSLRIHFLTADFENGTKPTLVEQTVSFELTQCMF